MIELTEGTYRDPIDGRLKTLPPGMYADPAGELRERRTPEAQVRPRAGGTHRNVGEEFRAKTAATAWQDAVDGKSNGSFGDPMAKHALNQWNTALGFVTGSDNA